MGRGGGPGGGGPQDRQEGAAGGWCRQPRGPRSVHRSALLRAALRLGLTLLERDLGQLQVPKGSMHASGVVQRCQPLLLGWALQAEGRGTRGSYCRMHPRREQCAAPGACTRERLASSRRSCCQCPPAAAPAPTDAGRPCGRHHCTWRWHPRAAAQPAKGNREKVVGDEMPTTSSCGCCQNSKREGQPGPLFTGPHLGRCTAGDQLTAAPCCKREEQQQDGGGGTWLEWVQMAPAWNSFDWLFQFAEEHSQLWRSPTRGLALPTLNACAGRTPGATTAVAEVIPRILSVLLGALAGRNPAEPAQTLSCCP